VERVFRAKEHLTRDMGGKATTSEFADAVIAAMEKVSREREPEARVA
jgi:isocitrate/isopropylmalate dehydrogenase